MGRNWKYVINRISVKRKPAWNNRKFQVGFLLYEAYSIEIVVIVSQLPQYIALSFEFVV